MKKELGNPLDLWFTTPPADPPEPDMGTKGDRDEPVNPTKGS